MSNKYLIGQRVIYGGAICTVCAPENNNAPDKTWINNPVRDYKHWVDEKNIKPLPNGQL